MTTIIATTADIAFIPQGPVFLRALSERSPRMMTPSWNPSAVRTARGLALSAADKAVIRSRMPVASDGKMYADAVFEGGGMRGVAFLGALRCMHDAGIVVRKAAGTSAGAITAAAVVSRMPFADLESAIGAMDFSKILSKKNRFIWNGSPDDDMNNLGLVLANLTIARCVGQYSSAPLLEWSNALLSGRLDTFGVLPDPSQDAPWHERRELKVVVSDITRGQMVVLPDDLPAYGKDAATFSVPEAVRMSMSIPLFFEPAKLGDSVIVDGGILSSFPLWIFDVPAGSAPCCPTFGLRVSASTQAPRDVKTALDVVTAIVQTMTVARDRHYSRVHDYNRIIAIDAEDVSITDFSMASATKDKLYERGYAAAKQFLLGSWSWDRYLSDRGF